MINWNVNSYVAIVARRSLTALLGAICIIALAEFLLRVFLFPEWTTLSVSLLVDHPVYGHFNRPNAKVRRYKPYNYDVINSTNSMGFRDREIGFKTDLAGIWLAGGSNSFGAGLEDDELYAVVLEQSGLRTVNLSSQGHRPVQQARVIRDLAGKGYRPRAIVFELTMNKSNFELLANLRPKDRIGAPLRNVDSANNKTAVTKETPFAALSTNVERLAAAARPSFMGTKARLIRHSAIYGWLKVGLNGIPFLRQKLLDWELTRHVDFKGALEPQMYVELPDNPSDALIESAADYFAEVQKWVGANLTVPFAVLVTPGHHEIYVERFRHWREHAGLTDLKMDPYRPRNLFMRALRRRAVAVIDPLPALQARDTGSLIFPDDGHLNASGHRALAEATKRWLDSAGISPKGG